MIEENKFPDCLILVWFCVTILDKTPALFTAARPKLRLLMAYSVFQYANMPAVSSRFAFYSSVALLEIVSEIFCKLIAKKWRMAGSPVISCSLDVTDFR